MLALGPKRAFWWAILRLSACLSGGVSPNSNSVGKMAVLGVFILALWGLDGMIRGVVWG